MENVKHIAQSLISSEIEVSRVIYTPSGLTVLEREGQIFSSGGDKLSREFGNEEAANWPIN